uniref:Uncharacterized protein n=1 Tax=Craspedostauros australis TaxID=1486917 RepID=A0A7R9WW35_9STRA|mmetsp:Transcript_21116/g.58733  ORF Transcript_21116/g.58733 Transcript_21116/m.58733 type:complete len:130 (+) Transcript_21116:169-558(+)
MHTPHIALLNTSQRLSVANFPDLIQCHVVSQRLPSLLESSLDDSLPFLLCAKTWDSSAECNNQNFPLIQISLSLSCLCESLNERQRARGKRRKSNIVRNKLPTMTSARAIEEKMILVFSAFWNDESVIS